MLIIFDLDDTLIDTSGSVTPFKMRECLQEMMDQGVPISDFEGAYQELLSLNSVSAKSVDAVRQFILKNKIDVPDVKLVLSHLTTPLPPNFSVATTPEAKEILSIFSSSHKLALVTGGYPPFQLEKLKKAGLDSSVFSKIHIPEDSIKRPYYEALLREFSISPRDVWVCGDRVQMDLVPAQQLQMNTVHMRWGRGRIAEREDWIDYSIATLKELKGIIK